jgi:hypothetical protein
VKHHDDNEDLDWEEIDYEAIRREVNEKMGEDWVERYGDASWAAAMAVLGEIDSNPSIVDKDDAVATSAIADLAGDVDEWGEPIEDGDTVIELFEAGGELRPILRIEGEG